MKRARGRTLAALVVACFALSIAAESSHAGATFHGAWYCNDRGTLLPLNGAKVELWNDQGWFGSHIVARGFTDEEGRFRLRAPANDEDKHWVRLVLRDRFDVHLKPWFSPWEEWFDTPVSLRNTRGAGERDLGGWQVQENGGRGTPKCAAWRGVHIAAEEYQRDVGERIPQPDLLIRGDAPSAGVPYVSHSAINWPPGYSRERNPRDITVMRHEFAHTIRHWFDGHVPHFLVDVARFGYLRQHEACLVSNEGFAFNEGWAEYWAGDYGPAPNCPGLSPTRFDVEGNVGAEIARLDRECFNISRRVIVATLRRAGWFAIHSMTDLRRFLPGCATASNISSIPVVLYSDFRRSTRSIAREARRELRALKRRTSRVNRGLRRARRLAARPLRCSRESCMRSIRARTRPAMLAGARSTLRLIRRTLAFTTSSRAVRRLGPPQSRKLERALARRRRAFGRALARIGARALRRALLDARPALRRDRTRRARRLVRRMRANLRAFRRARRSGRLPGSLRMPELVILDRPRRARARKVPASLPRGSAMALSCPERADRGAGFAIRGAVSPPSPGAKISLSYASAGTTVTRSRSADADGAFSDSFTASSSGPLDVRAAFPGDAFTAASSVSCRVQIEEPAPP